MGCVKWSCRVTSTKLAGFAKGVNHICYTSLDVLFIVLSNIWLRMEVDYGTELLTESPCRQNQLIIHQQQLTLLCCNKQMSLPCTNQSTEFCASPSSKLLSLFCVPSWEIVPFQQVLYIDTIDALHIFIKLHTLLTSLPEATGLYAIIWQALYAVRHSLFPLYTLDIGFNHVVIYIDAIDLITQCW